MLDKHGCKNVRFWKLWQLLQFTKSMEAARHWLAQKIHLTFPKCNLHSDINRLNKKWMKTWAERDSWWWMWQPDHTATLQSVATKFSERTNASRPSHHYLLGEYWRFLSCCEIKRVRCCSNCGLDPDLAREELTTIGSSTVIRIKWLSEGKMQWPHKWTSRSRILASKFSECENYSFLGRVK